MSDIGKDIEQKASQEEEDLEKEGEQKGEEELKNLEGDLKKDL